MRIRYIDARLCIVACAPILDLHHAPALREPRFASVPQALHLAHLKDQSVRNGRVPARLLLKLDIAHHIKVLFLQFSLYLPELFLCLRLHSALQCSITAQVGPFATDRVVVTCVVALLTQVTLISREAIISVALLTAHFRVTNTSLLFNVLLNALELILKGGE